MNPISDLTHVQYDELTCNELIQVIHAYVDQNKYEIEWDLSWKNKDEVIHIFESVFYPEEVLQEFYYEWTDKLSAKKYWEILGNVPIDEDECIEEKYLHFDIGTHREYIWHWFEEKFDISVADLMYGN